MARITFTVKRVTSLLKYLRRGRGLSNYQGGLEIVLRVSGGRNDALVGTLPLMRGGSQVSVDIPPEYYGNRIIVHGSERNHGDLIFQLDTTFLINEDGEWIVEPTPGRPDPVRRVKTLTIAFVDDWTEALRRLQQELEAEGADHQGLLNAVELLRLESFDRAFWQERFSLPSPSWAGQALSEIVNSDHINATVTMNPDMLKVDMDMRKPGGGRFGRAKFDFKLIPDRVDTPVTVDYDLDESTWKRIRVWEAARLDIKFSRPGLNSVTSANKQALETFFDQQFRQGAEDVARVAIGEEWTNIQNLWPTLKNLAPTGRRNLLPDALTLYRRSIARRVRKKVRPPGGAEVWSSVHCYRPRLAGAIETLVTDPAFGVLSPSHGARRGRR